MRVFLAIAPDAPAREVLADLLKTAQQALGPRSSALRWTPVENLHLTLHFFGEIDAGRCEILRRALTGPIAVAPFQLALDHFGVFPASGPPRALWLGAGARAADLTRVHQELGRRVAGAGFALEARPFSAHLTIARVREDERRRARGLLDALPGMRPAPMWHVDHVALVESDLSGPRAKYTTLHNVELRS